MGSFKDFVNNGKAPTIKEEPPMIQRPNVQSNRAVPQSIRRIPPKRPPRLPKRETDVLTEAENTIATLQEKIEQIFYRFGLAGLERLDEAIINCVENMLHPDGEVNEGLRPSAAAINRTVGRKATAAAPQRPAQQKKPRTALEIAAAALRELPPMDPNHEETVAAAPQPSVQKAETYGAPAPRQAPPPPPPRYEQVDPMAALEGEQLNAEERAMLQQALQEAGNETIDAVPVNRDMSALSLAAQALQR